MKLIPAMVESWDGVTLRVFIDGYTDGSDIGMKAEVCFPLADRPDYTGYKIEKGDAVWVMFNDGDPNSPIVMGFRNQNTGENKDTRRFQHKNFEAHAKYNMLQTSKNHDIKASVAFTVESGVITLKGAVHIEGELTTSGTISAKGDIKSNQISLQNHTHTEQGDGAPTSKAR